MNISEKRVVGSLFLLLGLSFLAVGLHVGQLSLIEEMLSKIFETALAGI